MRETTGRTVRVAALLCIVCSIVVAGAANTWRSKQRLNAEIDFKRNVLTAAGLIKADENADAKRILALFSEIDSRVIDLSTGLPAPGVQPQTFEQEKADRAPELLDDLRADDRAGIRQRSRYQRVYLVQKEGEIDQIVLRFYGRGLWSTMYGFIALDRDTVTIRGLNFYSHGETPGLGGEIDNPRWQAQWVGKKVYDPGFAPAVDVVKNGVPPNDPRAMYKVDALSGATITSNGVEDAVNFWLSDRGYGKFLARIREGETR